MADYVVSDASLAAVADAIRAKGGTSAPLAFPAGFVSAIGEIETGGGADQDLDFNFISVHTRSFTAADNSIKDAGVFKTFLRNLFEIPSSVADNNVAWSVCDPPAPFTNMALAHPVGDALAYRCKSGGGVEHKGYQSGYALYVQAGMKFRVAWIEGVVPTL